MRKNNTAPSLIVHILAGGYNTLIHISCWQLTSNFQEILLDFLIRNIRSGCKAKQKFLFLVWSSELQRAERWKIKGVCLSVCRVPLLLFCQRVISCELCCPYTEIRLVVKCIYLQFTDQEWFGLIKINKISQLKVVFIHHC